MAKQLTKIIIIDDDPISNFLGQKLISKLNLANRLKTFNNAEAGLTYILKSCLTKEDGSCPDLILLDRNMPVMDGLDIIEKLNKENINLGTHVKIAMLSSSFRRNDIDYLLELGVVDCLTKPLTEEQIVNLIEKHF